MYDMTVVIERIVTKKNYFKNETYMDESIIHNKLHSEFIVFNML